MGWIRRAVVSLVVAFGAVPRPCAAPAGAVAGAATAAELLRLADVGPGGVCVVAGSADAGLLADLGGRGRFIVHALDADAGAVDAGRRALLDRNLYGQVSLETWDGPSLPYGDDVVNLLIVPRARNVPREELLRVVHPDGVLLARDAASGEWVRTVKPRPKGMDDWQQYRHGPDRNPVSNDTLVDVPGRIQWLSTNGAEGKDVLSAGGRTFYASATAILARDAFNGLPLWNLRLGKGDGKCSPVVTPATLFTVYKQQLVGLDARTGQVAKTYDDGGVPNAILRVDDPRDPLGVLVAADETSVRALTVTGGKVLWRHDAAAPRALSAAGGALFLVTGNPKDDAAACAAVALDLADGKVRWEKRDEPWARWCYRSACGGDGRTVVFETGRFAVPKVLALAVDKTEKSVAHFLSAADGRTVRDYAYAPAMRHDENVRAFFLGGDKIAVHQMDRDKKSSTIAVFQGEGTGPAETFRALPVPPPAAPGGPPAPSGSQAFYCYPPVATTRFFIYGQMTFTDWQTHTHAANPITRGTCGAWGEGLLPANGLVYVFPKTCSCFSMLHGFGALAPPYARPTTRPHELEQGPAYAAANSGAIAKAAAPLARPDDWPIFRGDAWRTGSNPTAVPAELKTLWAADIPAPAVPDAVKGEWDEYPFAAGPLTPPVIAQGLAIVAQPHAHRVLAFDANDGKPRWTFVADGRIDSPPTVDRGLCLFGTRAGWVYCLRAADGQLVWRLRAAPAELRIVHCGQLESPWPAQGSVLVSNGLAYVGVGIHPLADGGVRVLAIEPTTGTIRWEKALTDMGYDEHGWHNRLGLEQDYFDLLVRDGSDKVAMSRWLFDPAGGAVDFKWHDAFYRVGEKSEAYMQRGTWSYGYAMNRPRMRRPLLVARGNSVLGANRVREVKDTKEPGGGTIGGPHLFRRDFKPGEKFDTKWDELPNDTLSRIGQYFPANRIAENVTWQQAYPGWIEAMTLAGDRLFVYAKDALHTYDATTGAATGDVAPIGHPVWDGLAAANGRLYAATREGRLVCLAGKE